MKQMLNIVAASRTLDVRNGRFDERWCHAVRNIAAIAFAALLAAGCSTYAADRYAISMDSQTELKQIAASSQGQGIAVDNFTASEPRHDLPLKFHPTGTGALMVDTPFGAEGATGRCA